MRPDCDRSEADDPKNSRNNHKLSAMPVDEAGDARCGRGERESSGLILLFYLERRFTRRNYPTVPESPVGVKKYLGRKGRKLT